MALFENCRLDIVEFNGLNLLGDFLNEKPSNYNKLIKNNKQNNEDDDDDDGIYEENEDINDSEITACERVQQKAAIAINRFAKEPQFATLLVELGGLYLFFTFK
jgi:hypothetical protein